MPYLLQAMLQDKSFVTIQSELHEDTIDRLKLKGFEDKPFSVEDLVVLVDEGIESCMSNERYDFVSYIASAYHTVRDELPESIAIYTTKDKLLQLIKD